MNRTDTLLLLCDFHITQNPDAEAIEKIRKVAEKLDGYDDDMPGLLGGISDDDILFGIRVIFYYGFGLVAVKDQDGLVVKYMHDDVLTGREDEFEQFLSALAPICKGFMQFVVGGDSIVRYEAKDGIIECLTTPPMCEWIRGQL